MADYYTNFSLVLKLNAELKQYALDLAKKAEANRSNDEPVPDGFPASLAEVIEDWNFDTEDHKDGIWLHSDCGGIDAACLFIQHLLQKFDIQGHIAFEWSYDCTQPRVDAFGGGAAFITSTEIESMTTSDWLRSKTP